MNDHEIREMFDTEPNLTLGRLAMITGKTVQELKAILMPGFNTHCLNNANITTVSHLATKAEAKMLD